MHSLNPNPVSVKISGENTKKTFKNPFLAISPRWELPEKGSGWLDPFGGSSPLRLQKPLQMTQKCSPRSHPSLTAQATQSATVRAQGCALERESRDMAEDNFWPTSTEGFGAHVGEPSTAAHDHLQPPMPSTLFQGAHLQHTCSTLAAHLQVTANQLSIAPVNAVCLFCLIPWENWKRVRDQNLNPHPSPLGCPGLSQPPPLPGSMGGGVTEPGEGQVTQIYFGL